MLGDFTHHHRFPQEWIIVLLYTRPTPYRASDSTKSNPCTARLPSKFCTCLPLPRSPSEKQCSKRYASLVECKDANYSTTKSRLL